MRAVGLVLAVALALVASVKSPEAGENAPAPSFTAEQAAQGKWVFSAHCAACHGATIFDAFLRYRNAEAFYLFISGSMPRHAPGSLSPEDYVDIVAYLLEGLGMPPGPEPLPTDRAVLARIVPGLAWRQP